MPHIEAWNFILLIYLFFIYVIYYLLIKTAISTATSMPKTSCYHQSIVVNYAGEIAHHKRETYFLNAETLLISKGDQYELLGEWLK